MAYTDVPVDLNEAFSVSQPKIRTNFLDINTLVSVDHVTFDAAGAGKHARVTLPEQAADPDSILANQATIFAKESAVTGNTGLFWQKEGTGVVAGATVEMTAFNLAVNTGYSYLPSGIIIQWGKGTATGGGVGAVNIFNLTFPNAVLSVVITQECAVGQHDSVQVIAATLATDRFYATSYSGSTATSYTINYIAIGY